MLASPAGAVAKYCNEYVSVCLSVCLSVCVCVSIREHISQTTNTIFANFVAHVASVACGSVLLLQGDEIPRSSGNLGVFPH